MNSIEAKAKRTSDFYIMLADDTGIANIHDVPNKAEMLRPQGMVYKTKANQQFDKISRQKPNHRVRSDFIQKPQPQIQYKSSNMLDDNYNPWRLFTLADDKDVKIPVELRTKEHTSFFNEVNPDIYKKEYEKIKLRYRSMKEKLPHQIDELNDDKTFLPPNDYDIFNQKLNI